MTTPVTMTMETKQMTKIELTDGGPIEGTFAIDLSPGPGAYEFRGRRGSGKTTLISSIDWLTGHRVDVTLHDGALSGKVEGFGVVAPIGGRKRRKGEFSLDTIDAEKFSLTDLVDPPGKTPEVRDAHAIKALAVLGEANADPGLYYKLAGGQESFDGLGIAKTDDPALLATRIKLAFDKEARECQNTAEAEAGHAAPLEHVPDGLDMSQSSDLAKLGTVRDEARDDLQALKSDRETGQQAKRDSTAATERLTKIKQEYDGPTVEEAKEDVQALLKACNEAEFEVSRLEQELAKAESVANEKTHGHRFATERMQTAKQHEEAVSALQETAALNPAYASAEDIATAQAEVAAASQTYDQGIRIRDVEQNLRKSLVHRKAAEAAEREATTAKNKAAQVFDILAQSLHTSHLEIRNLDGAPRLFVEHPTRGRCAFDRVNGLSDGERVDFTLRELLPHILSPGVLPIPQQVWQDLQPSDRMNLHKLAKEKGLFVFGAQVDDGNLRVAYLGEDDSE